MEQREYIPRKALSTVAEMTRSFPCVMVSDARQVGKSTMLKQMMPPPIPLQATCLQFFIPFPLLYFLLFSKNKLDINSLLWYMESVHGISPVHLSNKINNCLSSL